MKIWTLMPVRAVALLALAACDPAPTTGETSAGTAEALTMSCTSFAGISEASLIAAYGAENLVEQTLPGAEGESYAASVLFPNDPERRLEIVWVDHAHRTEPASITVSGERSAWTGPNGLSIGDELARVEEVNGRPFKLWGFGWDYGGWVSDWDGGAFAPAEGCMTRVRFQATTEDNNAQGDSEFLSNAPEIRDSAARVTSFALVFGTP